MSFLIDLLTNYGYWGMLIAAFLAGSFIPFSSEAVMLALMAAGLDTWPLVVYATIGNVAGSMFNYGVGRLGKLEWVEKYLHVSREKIEETQRFMENKGAWAGLLTPIPVLGSAIAITLGFTRANLLVSFVSITIGKFVRYLILAFGVDAIF